jgi:hypothetical protein
MLIEIYNQYWNLYKKFIGKNDLYEFILNLDVFEQLLLLYDEIDLSSYNDFTEEFYYYNHFWFEKLARGLNIKNNIEIMRDLFLLFIYATKIEYELGKECKFSTLSFAGPVCVESQQVKHLNHESKYKNQNEKQAHYFYEYYGLKYSTQNYLILFDSARKELLEKGDTLEAISKRDFVYSLHKYYIYLSEGINYE